MLGGGCMHFPHNYNVQAYIFSKEKQTPLEPCIAHTEQRPSMQKY